MNKNFENFCRICLNNDNQLVSINTVIAESKSYKDILEELSGAQICTNELLPSNLCIECSEKLSSSYKLKQQSLITENVIKEGLNKPKRLEILYDNSLHFNLPDVDNNLAIQNVCRICFDRTDQLISLLERCAELVTYKEMFEICILKNILPEESNAKNICNICSKLLINTYKLRAQSLISEKILTKFLKGQTMTEQNFDKSFDTTAGEEEKMNVSDSDTNEQIENPLQVVETPKKAKFKCSLCTQKFTTDDEYIFHSEVVHSQSLYKCQVCGKYYKSPQTARLHLYGHENRCKYCLQAFENPAILNEHLVEHEQKSEYPCGKCEQIFDSKSAFALHNRLHVNELHLCSYCGKSFKEKAQLKVHIDVHTGKKPYGCEYCGARFADRSALRNHVVIHTKERKYKCKICQNTFTRNQTLKRHILTHSLERNFICKLCDSRFQAKSHLQRHMITHSDVRKHKCPQCSKAFKRRDQLKAHFQNRHEGYTLL